MPGYITMTTKIHSDDENPFQQVANQRAGVKCEDMTHLALVFTVAHDWSDVWAGCRLLHKMSLHNGEARPGLAGYLNGRYFEAVAQESGTEGLEEIRDMARQFLGEE
jgi:hypothetical protein